MTTVGTFQNTAEIENSILQVLRSGRISYGPMSEQFEHEFANFHDCRYGVLVNSGTSALHVALQAAKIIHGWEDGSEVIVPALTFVATVNVILHNNLKPVLVDVSFSDYGIDTNIIEEKIGYKTVAIMPVHLFGQSCYMKPIVDLCQKYNLFCIEDSCETIGVDSYPLNQSVGSIGNVGCFSFYVAHHLVTGVGGMAITNDEDLYKMMRSLANHGMKYEYLPTANSSGFLDRRFVFDQIGHSFRATELEAAIGLSQIPHIRKNIDKRVINASLLNHLLSPIQKYIHLPIAIREHSYMMYPMVLADGNSKIEIMTYLSNLDIETRDMVPLTRQPCYEGMWNPFDYPNADTINNGGFYIGCHQNMTSEDIAIVSSRILEFFDYPGIFYPEVFYDNE